MHFISSITMMYDFSKVGFYGYLFCQCPVQLFSVKYCRNLNISIDFEKKIKSIVLSDLFLYRTDFCEKSQDLFAL